MGNNRRFALLTTLIWLLLSASCLLAEGLIKEFNKPWKFGEEVKGIKPANFAFIVDFTYSEKNGFKAIEYGTLSDSSFLGHRDAYPGLPQVETLHKRATRDFVSKLGLPIIDNQSVELIHADNDEWKKVIGLQFKYEGQKPKITIDKPSQDKVVYNHLGNTNLLYWQERKAVEKFLPKAVRVGYGEVARAAISDKLNALVLDDSEIRDLRPLQIAVGQYSQISDPELKEKYQREEASAISHFPGETLVTKNPLGACSRGVCFIAKAQVQLENFARPGVIQAFFPSDLIPVEKKYGLPVGRIVYSTFYDGKQFYAYPLTIYWKMSSEESYSGPKAKLNEQTAVPTSLDYGKAVDPEVQKKALDSANRLIANLVPKALILDQNKLTLKNRHTEVLRESWNTLPNFQKLALRQEAQQVGSSPYEALMRSDAMDCSALGLLAD